MQTEENMRREVQAIFAAVFTVCLAAGCVESEHRWMQGMAEQEVKEVLPVETTLYAGLPKETYETEMELLDRKSVV